MVFLTGNFLHDTPESAQNHCGGMEGNDLAVPIIFTIKGY